MIGSLGSYQKYNSKETFGAEAVVSEPKKSSVSVKNEEKKDEVKLSQAQKPKKQPSKQPQRSFWDRNLAAIMGITSIAVLGIMVIGMFRGRTQTVTNVAQEAKPEELLRKYVRDKNSPKGFQDVIGMEDVKDRLNRDYVEPLKDASVAKMYKEQYDLQDGGLPSGSLLIGDPGNGKTHIVKALAAELNADLYMLNMSDVGEIYIHGTGKNLAKALDEIKSRAKESKKPIILFMDELDSIPKRSGGDVKSHEVEELNTILQNINDLQQHGVILIGATNRADLIDDAILREGRFGNHIEVGYPKASARKQFLHQLLARTPKAQEFLKDQDSVGLVVEKMEGLSNASITGVVKNARKLAAMAGGSPVRKEHFVAAIEQSPQKRAEKVARNSENEMERFLEKTTDRVEKLFGRLTGKMENAGGIVAEGENEKILREAAEREKQEIAESASSKKLKSAIDEITAPKPVENASIVEPQPSIGPKTKEELDKAMQGLKAIFAKGEIPQQEYDSRTDALLAAYSRNNASK